MNLLDLMIKVGVQDETQGKLGSIAESAKSAVSTVAKVGATAVAAAATAVVAVTKQAVQAYADYEQLVGGVETLFGSASDSVIQNAQNAFRTAGLSANEYMETVTSFAASLRQSFDDSAEGLQQASDAADQAIRDMADNANKMGTSMDSIQAAYQGFAKQNYTMLDNLKLGYGGTKEEMERLLADAEALTGVHYDISNLADVYEAIHVIQTELGITGTTAEEAASTISGSWGMLKSSWQNMLVGIADGSQDFEGLMNNLVESATTFGNNILPVIEQALIGIAQLIAGLAPTIATMIPEMLAQILPPLLEAVIQIVGALEEALPMIIDTIIQLLPLVIEAGIQLIIALGGALLENLPVIIDAAVDIITTLVDYLIENIDQVIDAALEIMIALCDTLVNNLDKLVEATIKLIVALVGAIVRKLPDIIKAGVQIVEKLAEGLASMLSKIISGAGDLVKAFVDGIKSWFSDLKGIGKDIIDKVKEGIDGVISGAVTWGKDLIQNFIDGIMEKWNALKQKVADVAQSVKDFLGFSEPKKGPLSNFHTYAPDMMQLFAKGIEDNEDLVTDQIAKSFDFDTMLTPTINATGRNGSSSVVNNFYIQQIDDAQMDAIVRKVNRTLGGAIA